MVRKRDRKRDQGRRAQDSGRREERGTKTQVEGERAGEGTTEEDPPHRIFDFFNFFNFFNFFKEIQGFGVREAQKP